MPDATALSPTQQAALGDQITQAYKGGLTPTDIVAKLMDTPVVGTQVHDALMTGASADDIMKQFGGAQLAQFKATDPAEKVKAQSFLTNLWQGVKQGAGDLAHGADQLGDRMVSAGMGTADPETGETLPEFQGQPAQQTSQDADKALALAQAQEKARQADPAYQALQNTTGGKIGNMAVKAAPYVAGSLLAPEGVIPAIAMQGLVGAGSGALTPTTEDGQFGKNIATDATIGAVTEGSGQAIKAGGSALVKALSNAKANPAAVAGMTSQGLTPTLGTTNPLMKALANTIPEAKDAVNAAGKTDTVRAALKQLGVDGTDLSATNLNAAKANVWAPANTAVKSVGPVPVTPQLQTTMAGIAQKYSEDALPTFANAKVEGIISDVLGKAQSGQLTGSRLLDYLRDTKDLAFNADNQADREAFKAISQTLGDTLSSASPDAGAALARANQLHPKLLVLQDLASRAKDEMPSVGQFATSNSKYADANGVGPYTQLVQAAKQAYAAPIGSTGRWANLTANAVQYAPAALAGIGGLLHGGGEEGLTSMLLAHGGEKVLAKVLAKVVNKPVGAVSQQNQRSNLQNALSRVMGGAGVAGQGAFNAGMQAQPGQN